MTKDFLKSIGTYFQAIQLIKKLKLWKYFLVPAGLGLVLGGIFIGTAYGLSDNFGSFISGFWPWDFGKSVVETMSSWIGGFSIIILGILLYKHVLMAISAPFMGPVSEKVEEYLTGSPVTKPDSKKETVGILMRSIRLNARNLLIELVITIPLMILSLIPVVGIVATIIIFYVQSYYTGFGNMDYTLERYLNYKESKTFVKKHRGVAVGNGLVFTFMLFIPLIGIMITLPISTVASTIDTIKKLHPEAQLTVI